MTSATIDESIATISREEAQELAERYATLLREQFGARRVILFGSAAGDAPWHSRSDLDLAIEGLPPEKHWQALNACYELLPPELTLDLIPLESAWPELRARIEGEVEMLSPPVPPHLWLRSEVGARPRVEPGTVWPVPGPGKSTQYLSIYFSCRGNLW